MMWPTLTRMKEGQAVTPERCEQLLHQADLTMVCRFRQVHALVREAEHGRSTTYELYICQEDQLATVTHPQLLALIEEAQGFRTRLRQAVMRDRLITFLQL